MLLSRNSSSSKRFDCWFRELQARLTTLHWEAWVVSGSGRLCDALISEPWPFSLHQPEQLHQDLTQSSSRALWRAGLLPWDSHSTGGQCPLHCSKGHPSLFSTACAGDIQGAGSDVSEDLTKASVKHFIFRRDLLHLISQYSFYFFFLEIRHLWKQELCWLVYLFTLVELVLNQKLLQENISRLTSLSTWKWKF